jgi:UDP-N-acetylmuramoyl-L-alanyl-D-glutamate--2,6-diaminopimelate ligase
MYNVYNALAAATVALAQAVTPLNVAKGIERLRHVPGRLEHVSSTDGVRTFLDYAHTPDGLEKVLQAIREYTHRHVILVFGCRGNRDRGKRPLMGRIAELYADQVILTSDNPAFEDPQHIAAEIAHGLNSWPLFIADREEAVHYALSMAQPGDIVLITGKGREQYQLIGDDAIYYSDLQSVLRFNELQ